MRIAYLSSSTIPSRNASSIHVMKMCQAFRRVGHDVELYAPRRPEAELDEVWERLFDHYGIQEDFPITRLHATSWCKEYDYAVHAAIDVRRSQYDIVYSRNIAAATFTAWLGIPTIHEIHEPPSHLLSRVGYRRLIDAPGFQHLVVITNALKEWMLDFFKDKLPEERILVLPDGVDLERFEHLPDVGSAQRKLDLAPAPLTLGYAGHFYEGRGIETILTLASRFPQYQFLLMGGDDADVAKYSEQARDIPLPNVSFLGFVPNAKLPEYLAACDVLLMPHQRKVAASRGGNIAQWTSPMKMFEYMATGRLIISSDLPVLREILSEQNSALCQPEDVDGWSKIIHRAATDDAWRIKIGKKARQDVNQYTWQKRVSAALNGIQG